MASILCLTLAAFVPFVVTKCNIISNTNWYIGQWGRWYGGSTKLFGELRNQVIVYPRQQRENFLVHHSSLGSLGEMRRPSGLSIGGTWGQWRSRGGENKIWRIQTLFFPLVWLWCVSKWKWEQCCPHFYFLSFTFFASLLCSSLLWNATDEGAIAPKALVCQ